MEILRNFALLIQYDGTDYSGWQKQKNVDTVQGEIEKAIFDLTGEIISITGSGRTDAGVHAHGQVANFTINSDFPDKDLLGGLNFYLADSIVIKKIVEADCEFNSRFNAFKRTYRYYFSFRKYLSPFIKKYCTYIGGIKDISEFYRFSGILCGKHDFTSFCSKKDGSSSKIREIYSFNILKKPDETEIKNFPVELSDEVMIVEISANGFLMGMVRFCLGTIFQLMKNGKSPEDLEIVLQALDNTRAGPKAPAKGLFLHRVEYPEEIF